MPEAISITLQGLGSILTQPLYCVQVERFLGYYMTWMLRFLRIRGAPFIGRLPP
jgi:hypothetical protein